MVDSVNNWRLREKKSERLDMERPPRRGTEKTNGGGADYAFLKVGSIEALRASELIGGEQIHGCPLYPG